MIKVLVVDDSALVRSVLKDIINGQPDMQVVGAAPDPLAAKEMIKALSPDVLTLDLEMPRADGLGFLEKLMRLRPMPVVMVSTLTEHGSQAALRALELGAVDFVSRPKADVSRGLQEYRNEIAEKIRAAAKANLRHKAILAPSPPSPQVSLPPLAPAANPIEKLIVVGASTGGTEAIKVFLEQMPLNCPGILITQHMPAAFTDSFAKRMDSLCPIAVKEAEQGDRILPGHAYIAPGHSHLLVGRSGGHYVVELSDGLPVNRHRPSVDVLFHSAAQRAGANAVGVIMTGMGKDGAAGMLEMKQAGAYNFAQDEATCVVFGMPKEAIAAGGVNEVVPIQEMAARVMNHLAGTGHAAGRRHTGRTTQ
jgi:two-component system chemotaxis response regulator CheB